MSPYVALVETANSSQGDIVSEQHWIVHCSPGLDHLETVYLSKSSYELDQAFSKKDAIVWSVKTHQASL